MQPPTKHLLSLDVGNKRIGLALASYESLLPQTYGTIEMDDQAVHVIGQKVTDNNVQTLIVGLPRGLDGQSTTQTEYVTTFVNDLKKLINVPIKFQDEALTSKMAEEELAQRGVSYNKGDVDTLAATYILKDYIEENRESIK